MRIPVVRDRDATTTGGSVIALKATIHHKGKKIALRGEHATCGNCKGSWPVYGTGDRMCNRGTPVVLDGDSVLCPCGKNRVIADPETTCFVHKTRSAHGTMASLSRVTPPLAQYDEQFTLLDEARRPLANVRYGIVANGGRVIAGLTDANGKTERVVTRSASNLKLQLEK